MLFKTSVAVLSASIALLSCPAAASSAEIDWQRIQGADVTLFYPGVASWEFLNGDDHRLGAKEIKKGKKECRHCHMSKEGALDLKAAEIASGAMRMKRSHNPFEPEPVAGRKGTMTARVKAAYDGDHAFIRVEWDSRGTGWQKKGSPDRVSIQMNGTEPYFAKYGCFVTCHNDASSMPSSPSARAVASHPAYNGREDVRLYAFYAKGAWDAAKTGNAGREKTGLIDLRSMEFDAGKATERDGWVYDDRVWEDNGQPGAGAWASGRYSAVFKVRLKSSDGRDVNVMEGDPLPVAISIHDDGGAKRRHYVSFPLTIGVGAHGDVIAAKVSR